MQKQQRYLYRTRPRDVSTKATGAWRKNCCWKEAMEHEFRGRFSRMMETQIADSIDLFDLLSAGTGFKARLASEKQWRYFSLLVMY
jgi:hypothetical protein